MAQHSATQFPSRWDIDLKLKQNANCNIIKKQKNTLTRFSFLGTDFWQITNVIEIKYLGITYLHTDIEQLRG